MTANFEGAKHFKYDLAEVLSLYLLAPTTIIQLIITCLCPIIIFIHSQEWTNDIININCQWLRTQLERNWNKPTHHEVSRNFCSPLKCFELCTVNVNLYNWQYLSLCGVAIKEFYWKLHKTCVSQNIAKVENIKRQLPN